MKRFHARQKLGLTPLDADVLLSEMRKLFPKRNEYGSGSYAELAPELARFGIRNLKEFRRLMKKHRRTLLADEKFVLSQAEIDYLRSDVWLQGISSFERKTWYAYPGLVRNALELEYGEIANIYMVSEQT